MPYSFAALLVHMLKYFLFKNSQINLIKCCSCKKVIIFSFNNVLNLFFCDPALDFINFVSIEFEAGPITSRISKQNFNSPYQARRSSSLSKTCHMVKIITAAKNISSVKNCHQFKGSAQSFSGQLKRSVSLESN